jgi:hypothetical protein
MGFKNIFKDSNDINEQSVAAFVSLTLVIIITICDVVTGLLGMELIVKEFIFVSLLAFTAAALGIAGYKTLNNKEENNKQDGETRE